MMKQENNIRISFFGATGTVTGSKYLVETADKKILVDCGLFQGVKELRLLNWQDLPVDASSIDVVLLTHGHLDHVGYLPLLIKQGFKGIIYATSPTIEVAKLILLDSARIQEEDANRANAGHYSKHKPAKPLYTTEEAEAVFPFFCPKPVSQWIEVDGHSAFRFRSNGHIIGASFIELKIRHKLLVFSGDIGRREDPLLREPERPEAADILIIESTYGNRLHPANAKRLLANEINKAAARQGTIIIPSFAVERSQLIMYWLWQLKREREIPSIPVYIDSPMASHVLDIFRHYPVWHKLSSEEMNAMSRDIEAVQEQRETARLISDTSPKIVIAGSGMATGGRVLSYFEHYLGDPDATILLVGYQGEGTRGRSLLDGAKELKMRGKLWPVKASVAMVEGLSAHADQSELISWLSKIKNEPTRIVITHGEQASSHALSENIKQVYGWNACIPRLNQTIVV